jgi:hypothetical protein
MTERRDDRADERTIGDEAGSTDVPKTRCLQCGYPSSEERCPRCGAAKPVVGACTGACMNCGIAKCVGAKKPEE